MFGEALDEILDDLLGEAFDGKPDADGKLDVDGKPDALWGLELAIISTITHSTSTRLT